MPADLLMLLLDVLYLTLLMQRLGQQNYQTTVLIATVYPLFYFDLNIRLSNIQGGPRGGICLAPPKRPHNA